MSSTAQPDHPPAHHRFSEMGSHKGSKREPCYTGRGARRKSRFESFIGGRVVHDESRQHQVGDSGSGFSYAPDRLNPRGQPHPLPAQHVRICREVNQALHLIFVPRTETTNARKKREISHTQHVSTTTRDSFFEEIVSLIHRFPR